MTVSSEGTPDPFTAWVASLRHGLPYERRAAAVTLGRAGDVRAVPVLCQALHDQDERVRTAAIEGLVRAGLVSAWPLCDVFQDAETPACEGAMIALLGIGEAATAVLCAALDAPQHKIREGAATVLGRLRDQQAVPALCAGLGDRAPEVRIAVAASLAQIADPAALPALVHVLAQVDHRTRQAAADALVTFGAVAVPVLIGALADSNRLVRGAAAYSLGRIGDSNAVAVLGEALADSGRWVRLAAARALGRIGSRRAAASLRRRLHPLNHDRERDPEVVRAIRIALHQIKGTPSLSEDQLPIPSGPPELDPAQLPLPGDAPTAAAD